MTSLRPNPGQPYLSVSDALERLRSAFPFLHLDHREGLRFVSARLARRHPFPDHDEIDRLLSPLVESAEVIVADEPSSDTLFLKTFLIPNEPVIIAWVDPGQSQACRGLLARYAEALGYSHAADTA